MHRNKIKSLLCFCFAVILLFSLMCPAFAYSETGYIIDDTDTFYEEYATFGDEDTYKPSGYREYRDGYYIESYNVDINITKENVYEIEETIVAYFDPSERKHGIIRNIPLDSNVMREDGTSDYKYTSIKNVSITDENSKSYNYEKSISTDMASYKIGSADIIVAGLITYKLSYEYHLSGDTIPDADEVYFNIIGTEWDTNIYNVTFNITTPDPIDINTLGFSIGEYGTTGHNPDNLKYEINGNTLSGKYEGKLSSYEGITIRCLFPEGYFEIPLTFKDFLFVFTLVIPTVLFIVSFLIYKKIKKENEPIEVIEFYPPDELHSLDIAHIHKEEIDRKDIFSLMLYCASRGYIEITEDTFLEEFSFKYVKKCDSDNVVIRKFLFSLFTEVGTVLTMDDVAEDFDKVVADITKEYTFNGKYIIKKNKKSKPLAFFSIASLVSGVALPLLMCDTGSLVPILIIYIISTVLGKAVSNATKVAKKKKGSAIFASLAALSTLVFVFPLLLKFKLEINILQIIIAYTVSVCISVLKFILVERTPEGKILYGRVLGFKRFLETAEKEKLEALVEETPTYFYDILPYTYVLGISDKWVEKFDDIAMRPEMDTYKINTHTFGSSLDILDKSFDSAYREAHPSTSSSSGGRGSSGGGSSGGGSGGGGGSSW